MQIAVRALGRADADALVGKTYMERIGIRSGMDGHGLDPHFLAGPDDTERYLAAIGDQYFFKHALTSTP
jgi:hypothetical protein